MPLTILCSSRETVIISAATKTEASQFHNSRKTKLVRDKILLGVKCVGSLKHTAMGLAINEFLAIPMQHSLKFCIVTDALQDQHCRRGAGTGYTELLRNWKWHNNITIVLD